MLATRPCPASAGFLQGTQLRSTAAKVQYAAPRTTLTISAKYRGKGTDLSKVEQFKRTQTDTGSPEVQVARLSARVQQLTTHLQEHRKDFATRRGLQMILGQRKRLLEYLARTDRTKYEEIISTLNIKRLKDASGRVL